MIKRAVTTMCLMAGLAAPCPALADTTVAADPAAGQVAALDGTVVWVSGEFGAQVLMHRSAAGITRVAGAPTARSYRSLDLGRDAAGDLVLTYQRCATTRRCVIRRDDLQGRRRSVPLPAPARCTPNTAPALWRDRAAYGLLCRTAGGRADDARSGLYVFTRGGTPRRLPLPRDAVRFGISDIAAVDLRGTRVAAVAADIYEYVFSETVSGRDLRSFLAAASEGDSDEHAVGLALGSGGVLWALVDAEHAGDPNLAIIHRRGPQCLQSERVETPAEPGGFRYGDLAVDGDALYLVAPGTGIVTHAFAPERACP